MKYLNKLPNSRREPAGLERVILRKLPATLLGGTLIPLFVSVASHLFPPAGTVVEIAKHLKTIDILSIATGLTVWTAAFTVAIGCVVVVLMKGPGYVADAYDLVDSEHPGPD
jgi:hypothetical protein